MTPAQFLMLSALIPLTACTTPAQRRAVEKAAIEKEAAQEISRICDLPAPEREAELKKIKDESGMVLYCGKP